MEEITEQQLQVILDNKTIPHSILLQDGKIYEVGQ